MLEPLPSNGCVACVVRTSTLPRVEEVYSFTSRLLQDQGREAYAVPVQATALLSLQRAEPPKLRNRLRIALGPSAS